MSFTVELDEQTAAVVQELATNEKRTASDVIRDAVAAYPGRSIRVAGGKKKRPLPKGAGQYSSGQTDIAQNIRSILRKDVEEGRWP